MYERKAIKYEIERRKRTRREGREAKGKSDEESKSEKTRERRDLDQKNSCYFTVCRHERERK